MKEYEEKFTPAVKRKFLANIKCDICGSITVTKWKKNQYDAIETEVKMRTGENYPSGGSGEETTIDICPDCFTSKLIPWVKSHGGNPTVEEWDW